MREAFAENFSSLASSLTAEQMEELTQAAADRIDDASTIHALLEARGHAGFSRNRGNPVDCDMIIVDEASMIDLELFLALLEALPERCRIVLLGDKNQLAAVETGNVFYDLTRTDVRGASPAIRKSDASRAFCWKRTGCRTRRKMDCALSASKIHGNSRHGNSWRTTVRSLRTRPASQSCWLPSGR